MSDNIKFLLTFDNELLEEGCGFRYQGKLSNPTPYDAKIKSFSLKNFKLKDTKSQRPLLPQLTRFFYASFPEKIPPFSTFDFEGELLTHFNLKANHSYQFQLQAKYLFLKKVPMSKKNQYQTLLTEPFLFQAKSINSIWHKDIERKGIQEIAEKTGYILKEILVLPLDRFSAYTFNIVPLILPEDRLLVLQSKTDAWRKDLLLDWLQESYPYGQLFKEFEFLTIEDSLLYRLIFSFYAAHEVSPPTEDENNLYLPDNW